MLQVKDAPRTTPARRARPAYDAPNAYEALIEPRYAPIAGALVAAARPRPGDDALELGAGTGLVTKRVAGRVRSLVATDLSPAMLDVARRSVERPNAVFATADYNAPLPFLDASFNVVLSGLTYVQDELAPLEEIARVLRPGGRLALAMWGASYHELRLLSDAAEAIGRPPLTPPSPSNAVHRLESAGFHSVTRTGFELVNEFGSVDEYVAYRRGFGTPAGASPALYCRYLDAVERRAGEEAAPDGSFTLGWSVAIITAVRP
ncbi:MAG: class I SAM-dependent methyltransferase [Gaiellaceae bacterium]